MIKKFLDEMRKDNKKSENTLEAYERDLIKYESFLRDKGITSIVDAKECHVEEFLFTMKEEKQSQGTINRRLSSIKSVYKYAISNNLIKENPSSSIKSNKVYKKTPVFLTIDEMETLLELPDDSEKGIRDRAILEILYGTGIKVSEMINLNVTDVNFPLGYLICQGNYGKARIVPMGRYAKSALLEYVEHRKSILREGLVLDGALFVNYQGNRFTRQGFWKVMKGYGEKTDFCDKLSPNTLRNSFAIHMLQNGANVKAVQELMGNDDMQSMEAFMEVAGVKIKDVYNKTHPRA